MNQGVHSNHDSSQLELQGRMAVRRIQEAQHDNDNTFRNSPSGIKFYSVDH